MKYLEELEFGDCYQYNKEYYVITTDFKQNGKKLVINLANGQPKWFDSNTIIDPIDIFTLDKESNVIAIKERKSDDINSNPNIY